MPLKCDNPILVTLSKTKDWWKKEDVQGNSDTIVVSIRAASMHENQNIAKFFQGSYSERVLQ